MLQKEGGYNLQVVRDQGRDLQEGVQDRPLEGTIVPGDPGHPDRTEGRVDPLEDTEDLDLHPEEEIEAHTGLAAETDQEVHLVTVATTNAAEKSKCIS